MLAFSHLSVPMCSFVRIRCLLRERLTELCAISTCEHLLSIIKTILTNYYWSAVFRKIHTTFFTVFLTHSIGRIIIQSEFKIHFSVLQRPLPWQYFTATKIAPELITRKCNLNTYFYKITLNYTWFYILYIVKLRLHRIYHHKYYLYEFQTFLLVTIRFKPCWKSAVFMDITRV